ncbi:MAG: helix-turn-helix domain-containing protein [Oscillospiraceae bacterium]
MNRYGIVHFYCFESGSAEFAGVLAVPDGCVDILFCCTEHPAAYICGTVLEPTLTLKEKNSYYFGVRFEPGYNPILNEKQVIPLLIEQMIPYEDLIKDRPLFEKITESRSFLEQIGFFMESYLKIYSRTQLSPDKNMLYRFITREIVRTGGEISLDALSEQSGYTARYIHKTFTAEMGLSPKLFARIIRFQQLIGALNQSEGKKLIDAAADAGYFDQSHMLKDFKTFTGITPKKYLTALSDNDYAQKLIIL